MRRSKMQTMLDEMGKVELVKLGKMVEETLEARAHGEKPRPRRRSRRVVRQERDMRLGRHLRNARNMLKTQQIADLLFEGEKSTAESRLYRLQEDNFVTLSRHYPQVVPVWELTPRAYKLFRESDSEKRPDLVSSQRAKHLVSINDMYVEVAGLLAKVFGAESADWVWNPEPMSHREFGWVNGKTRRKIKPDAEVVLLDEMVFLIERQTAAAKEKPEVIHDKVFRYHAYENSVERAGDPREIVLLWACDAERDIQAVRDASVSHPTKTPYQLGLREWETKRMWLAADSPAWVASAIRDAARARYSSGA